jgi:hypothetical protein
MAARSCRSHARAVLGVGAAAAAKDSPARRPGHGGITPPTGQMPWRAPARRPHTTAEPLLSAAQVTAEGSARRPGRGGGIPPTGEVATGPLPPAGEVRAEFSWPPARRPCSGSYGGGLLCAEEVAAGLARSPVRSCRPLRWGAHGEQMNRMGETEMRSGRGKRKKRTGMCVVGGRWVILRPKGS